MLVLTIASGTGLKDINVHTKRFTDHYFTEQKQSALSLLTANVELILLTL